MFSLFDLSSIKAMLSEPTESSKGDQISMRTPAFLGMVKRAITRRQWENQGKLDLILAGHFIFNL